MLREHCTRAEFQKRLSCPCCNIRECVIIWATAQPEREHYESDSMAVKIDTGDDNPAVDPCCVAGEVVCGIFASLFCVVFLSAGQCAIGNGDPFVPHASVARNGSTSNADRRICDFYDTAGGRRSGGRQNERSDFERTKRFVYSTVMIEPFQVSCRNAAS